MHCQTALCTCSNASDSLLGKNIRCAFPTARFLIAVHWNTLWDAYRVSTNESNLPQCEWCSTVIMPLRTVVKIDECLKSFQVFEGTFATASHRDEFNFCCFGQAFWRVPVPVGPSRGCWAILMYWCILPVFLWYSGSQANGFHVSFSKFRKVEDLVVSARMLSLRSAQVLALYEYAAAQFILDSYMILLKKIWLGFMESLFVAFQIWNQFSTFKSSLLMVTHLNRFFWLYKKDESCFSYILTHPHAFNIFQPFTILILHADAHAIEAMCIPKKISGTDTWCASRLAVARTALQTAEAGNDFSVCNGNAMMWSPSDMNTRQGK